MVVGPHHPAKLVHLEDGRRVAAKALEQGDNVVSANLEWKIFKFSY
jgi:hypothetical protein